MAPRYGAATVLAAGQGASVSLGNWGAQLMSLGYLVSQCKKLSVTQYLEATRYPRLLLNSFLKCLCTHLHRRLVRALHLAQACLVLKALQADGTLCQQRVVRQLRPAAVPLLQSPVQPWSSQHLPRAASSLGNPSADGRGCDLPGRSLPALSPRCVALSVLGLPSLPLAQQARGQEQPCAPQKPRAAVLCGHYTALGGGEQFTSPPGTEKPGRIWP